MGNFVDDFGDKTGEGFPFVFVHGEHENSSVIKSDVYVKTSISGESLYFQVFNTSMTMKETFPDKEFGTVKIKFPNGEVKEEEFFFSNNTALESPANKNRLIRNYLMKDSGELKILIDLTNYTGNHDLLTKPLLYYSILYDEIHIKSEDQTLIKFI